jgi:hypothetical protein
MDTPPPYKAPIAKLADPPQAPGRFSRVEKFLLVFLVINASVGFFTIGGVFLASGSQSAGLALVGLALPVFGFVAALLMFRMPALALALGALFYLAQSIGYLSSTSSWLLRSGFNITVSFPQNDGFVVINLLAIVLVVVHIFVFWRRYEGSRQPSPQSAA